MTREQYEALLAYIDARIAEKIEDAFGRDCLLETIVTNDARDKLRREFSAWDREG